MISFQNLSASIAWYLQYYSSNKIHCQLFLHPSVAKSSNIFMVKVLGSTVIYGYTWELCVLENMHGILHTMEGTAILDESVNIHYNKNQR